MQLRPNHLIFAFLLGFVFLSCFLEKFGLILRMSRPSKLSAGQASRTTGRGSQAWSRRQAANSRTDRTKLLTDLQKMTLYPSVVPCEGGTPELNVVFIKTHKTGSTTLSHIINRFGYKRGLSFAMNKRHRHNGHLGYITLSKTTPRETFLPPIGVSKWARTFRYNLMTGHARYDRASMDSFMTSPTHYITILRDPGYQFESAFSHFQFDDAFLTQERKQYKTIPSKLEHFINNPEFYRNKLKHLSWEGERGLRWYYAKNNQMFDLGLDHEYHNDVDIVSAYIDKLQAELDLVLITEYYEESLLLLKNYLCWDTADILYVSKNMRPPSAPVPESLRKKLRQWNSVDMKLYKHFNQSLWNKIQDYGPNFQSDLAKFREQLKEVVDECVGDLKISSQGRFKYSDYKVKAGSGVNCTLIAESKSALFYSIWRLQAHQTNT